MQRNNRLTRIVRISPLELTMRTVRESMEEFTAEFSFHSSPGTFELLSIEPPEPPDQRPRVTAEIVRHPKFR